MIGKSEIHRMAAAEGLRFDQIEKDHVIVWILHALSVSGLQPEGWVFRGGTCLRHCYYGRYRFSEDLDFSCISGGSAEEAQDSLERLSAWVEARSGIRTEVQDSRIGEGEFQVEIPLEYSRGGPRRRGLPQVKFHLTFDEPLLSEAVACTVKPRYSDLPEGFPVVSYGKEEIVAEKIRALLQQQSKWVRPRDLYDLWFMLCHKKERYPAERLRELFEQKCTVRRIPAETEALTSELLKESDRKGWQNRLGPLLKDLPDYDDVWRDWVEVCGGIFPPKN